MTIDEAWFGTAMLLGVAVVVLTFAVAWLGIRLGEWMDRQRRAAGLIGGRGGSGEAEG